MKYRSIILFILLSLCGHVFSDDANLVISQPVLSSESVSVSTSNGQVEIFDPSLPDEIVPPLWVSIVRLIILPLLVFSTIIIYSYRMHNNTTKSFSEAVILSVVVIILMAFYSGLFVFLR